jgi:chemotaxis protein MotB
MATVTTPAARAKRIVKAQGSNIFWGTLSIFFAAAACYFFWQNWENEQAARTYRDQESNLLLEQAQLRAQVEKLQGNVAQVDLLLKGRDEKMREQADSIAAIAARAAMLDEEMRRVNDARLSREQMEARVQQAIQGVQLMGTAALVKRGKQPVLRISNSALFAPASMELTQDAKDFFRRLAKTLDPLLANHELRIEGFTDSDPITGSMKEKYPSNFELSSARAAVVARFLSDECGISGERITIIGRGSTHPVKPNTTSEGKAENRRIEMLLNPVDAVTASPAAPGSRLTVPRR